MKTEEQIAAKKKYSGEKKASMKRRDDHHDYTERRMYMITRAITAYQCQQLNLMAIEICNNRIEVEKV